MAARLAACAAFLCFLLSPSSSQANSTVAAGYRTAYHFQPAMNWMNDPNGPMHYKGVYHIFYQFNPDGATWGNGTLSWGHSVSRDLVNWVAVGNALQPDSAFDNGGCWSGSATILSGGRPAIMYTGRVKLTGVEVQNVAFPKNLSDPFLRDWVKPKYNPVIPLPRDVDGRKFRDPSTAWLGRDGLWRVAVAAGFYNGTGSTLVYRSDDFKNWERNPDPLYSSGDAGMVECPELFKVASRNGTALSILKLSLLNTSVDRYATGFYNEAVDKFVPAEPERGNDPRSWRRLDHGKIYASKSFYDERKRRRVLWAWVEEADGGGVSRGWAGVQIVPRAMWLDADGKRLVQWPVEEIESLRRKRVGLEWAPEVEAGGTKEITGILSSQADVDVVFEIPNLEEAEALHPKWLLDPQGLCAEKDASVRGGVGPFGLLVMASADLEENTAVFFRVFKHLDTYNVLMCTDLTKSSTKAGAHVPSYGAFLDVDVQKDRFISLRTLIDHTMVESFGDGGRTCMTARVYPEHVAPGSSHLYVFNHGTGVVKLSKLEAWEMATAAVNA